MVILFLTPVDIRFQFCPSSWAPEHQPQNMVFSPHWYDLQALFYKAFGDFTVNVQGLSRVCSLRKLIPLQTFNQLHPFYVGDAPMESYALGSRRGPGEPLAAD